MDSILQGLDGVICYLDDIMVTGSFESEHLDNLFRCLREHGVQVKRNKCTFMKDSVQYLGHQIDAQGLHTTAPIPKNVQELRSFLGLLNYYGRFIANLIPDSPLE